MPIVWTKDFPIREKPVGYLRLLLARYRYFNRYALVRQGLLPRIRQVPGYRHEMAKWKDMHGGRRCFVIGNGPSLKRMDLSQLRQEITIGSNAIYKSFDQWGWHTTFILFEDIEQTELRRHDIPRITGPVKLAALYNAYAFRSDEATLFMNCRTLDEDFMAERFPMFSLDFPHIVYLASTITFVALQLAFHLGCDPVYLLGVDHDYGDLPRLYPPCKITITEENYSLVRGLHMEDDYYKIGDVIGVPPVEYMEAGYRKAREVFEGHGRSIVNVGFDSKLGVFELGSFESLFPHSKPHESRGTEWSDRNRPKALFIGHDAGQLGAQLVLLRLIRQFVHCHGWECRIVIREPNGSLLDQFRNEGETYVFWPHGHEDSPHTHQQRIRDTIRQWKPDFILSNTAMNGDVATYLDLDTPLIVYVHELQWWLSQLDEARYRAFVQAPDAYLAVSDAVRKNLVANHGISQSKIEVVYNAVDLASIQEAGREISPGSVRTSLGIPLDALVVGSAGRIDERKGWDLFLEVSEAVLRQTEGLKPVFFLWIGHGPKMNDLIQYAQRKDLRGTVKTPGFQENPFPYYNAMDLLLICSRDDPFPLVMLEAGYHSKPVLAFDGTGGASEFIEQESGFLVPAFDTDQMATRVLQLLSNDQLRQRLGANARMRVEQDFDIKNLAQRIAEFLDRRFGVPAGAAHDPSSSDCRSGHSAAPSFASEEASRRDAVVSSQSESDWDTPPGPRVVRFPLESLGLLLVRTWGSRIWHWVELGAARGHVTVPGQRELMLVVGQDWSEDLSALTELDPDDLQGLHLSHTRITDRQLRHLARLRGLRTVDLRDTDITDDGIRHLYPLRELKELYLPQQISEDCASAIEKELPGCKVCRS